MNDGDGGRQLSSAEKQRATLTELARRQVLEAYRQRTQDFKSPADFSSASVTSNKEGATQTQGAPVISRRFNVDDKTSVVTSSGASLAAQIAARENAREAQEAQQAAAERQALAVEQSAATAAAPAQAERAPQQAATVQQVTPAKEDWRKYHEAWQDYYQKYYGAYYGKVAQDYIAREKMRYEREQAEKRAKEESERKAIASNATESEKVQEEFRSKIQARAMERASVFRRSKHFLPLLAGILVIIGGFLVQYNQVIAANVVAYVSPGNASGTTITEIDPTITVAVHEQPTLIIPKINVEVPVQFGVPATDTRSINNAMMNGIVHFAVNGASAVPGEIGNYVVSGHSAGNISSTTDFKFIFSGLTRLEPGDLIYMDYEGTRYSYKMTGSRVVEPTDVQSIVDIADENEGIPMITLITCTPLGTSKYRLLVYGEQISPSHGDSEIAERHPIEESGDSGAAIMPANEDAPFTKLWKWIRGES